MSQMRIADHQLSIDEAVARLQTYSTRTLRWYDFGGASTAPLPSPADRVTLDDLGRMVCVGASLTYARGWALLDSEVAWPSLAATPLHEVPDGEAFFEDETIDALWVLFDELIDFSGLHYGTVSKLLHLKFPETIPIADSALRGAYVSRAVEAHNDSARLRQEFGPRRRTRTANIRAYWYVFAQDLRRNQESLEVVRVAMQDADEDSRYLWAGVSTLRIQDALAWSIGRPTAR